MPKVRALGSDHMRACAAAKDAGKAAVLSPPDMRYRLKQLLCACHYERREQLEAALNLPAGRLAYIARNPETCKIGEAVAIQTLASTYGVTVFDELRNRGAAS